MKAESTSEAFTPFSPCNIYIGANFAVRLHQYFKFRGLIENQNSNGVIITEFDKFLHLNRMTLSRDAQRVKEVPNAGGSSVISEMLSAELLARCFGAILLKVGLYPARVDVVSAVMRKPVRYN